ncbi:MAG: type II CRISPR RNA-guided endonuclease Cas9 [Epulopiscium sp. Nele67-Bin004]|nr:MAG: type II CRISPR RNA-guided endonuclease Cas9 [Epulopiscium sp. Nele67-Bin004]
MNTSYLNDKLQLRHLLAGKPYRVGLDLGVGSIGFAVVSLECIDDKTIPTDLILNGSRIFETSIGAAERRGFRGGRNAHHHDRNRKLWLWKVLSEHSMMLPPEYKGIFIDHKNRRRHSDTSKVMFSKSVLSCSPYDLRYKGLTHKLELPELGYALYHLSNHRGSSAMRVNPDATEEEKTAQKSIQETQEFAKKHSTANTFVELLIINNQENNTGFRNKLKRKYALMPTRNLILNELSTLLDTQSKFYPDIFTEEFINQIKYIVNYENEMIVPDSGRCIFFEDEPKLPKCNFLNEERRIWEALNNTRIDGKPLSMEQKQNFYEHLRAGNDLTPAIVKKEVKYDNITLQGRNKDNQKIQGFRFKDLENKDFWSRLDDVQKDRFFADWTNCADDNKLLDILQCEYNLTYDEAYDTLNSISLIGDYAPIGKTAMQIVVEYIKNDSLSYLEAVNKAIEDGKLKSNAENIVYDTLPYYGAVLSESTQGFIGKAWHSSLKDKFKQEPKRYKTPHTNKDEKKYGRIANPVVHQTLNELRKLVNEIVDIFGYKPAEIGIELSRELKVGTKERDKIISDQNANEKQNKRIMDEYCIPNGVDEKYILRFQLAEEQGCICPYCLERFKVKDVVSGDVDIDHIFPQSQSADNSRNNLVMAHKTCNVQLKGNRTPYNAFSGDKNWSEIIHFVKEQLPNKLWRFTKNDEEYREWLNHRGFLARFSTDTSYIAKAAAAYMQCLYVDKSKKNVRTLKGGETATLRKAWGLHGITHELGNRFVDDNNGVYFHPAKKMRLDHRHHALDAVTIAYSTNGYSKLINTLSGKGFELQAIREMIPLPNIAKIYQNQNIDETALGDKETFATYIKDKITNHSYISIKYDHNKNGGLLKQTAYTILFEKAGEIVLSTKKKIDGIKDNLIEVDKQLLPKMYTEEKLLKYSDSERAKLQKLLEHNKLKREDIMNAMPTAEQELTSENESLKAEGKKERTINENSILKRALSTVGSFYYQISNNEKSKKFIVVEPAEDRVGVAYDTDENLRIDLYHDSNGKLCGEVIRKVNAMNKDFIPDYQKSGYTLLESIYQGDTLEIDLVNHKTLTDKSNLLEKAASVKAPNAPAGRTYVRVATFTEVGSGIQIHLQNLLKAQKGNDASFNINSMQKWNVRRVVLSSVGLTRYRSPILKNKQ